MSDSPRFCTSCGAALVAASRSCTVCGASVPPLPAPQTAAPAAPLAPAGRQLVITNRLGAAVRAAPSSDAPIVATVDCGTLLDVVGPAQNGFQNVRAPGGSAAGAAGWVGELRLGDAATRPDCSGAIT